MMCNRLDSIIQSYSGMLIDSVCKSIRIPSLYSPEDADFPYGVEIERAACHARKTAHELGFRTIDVDRMVSWAEYGNSDEVVAVMGHLDIVSPGKGWSFDPYAGTVEDGYILGRGSQDDKGPLFSSLFALKAVADLNFPLQRKIRIIFGVDEETGLMRDVETYLKKEGVPVMAFTPDGEYPIVNTEKGTIKAKAVKKFSENTSKTHIMKLKGGESLGSVPAYAYAVLKGQLWILTQMRKDIEELTAKLSWNVSCSIEDDTMKISVFGKASHASLPDLGENAIARLLFILALLDIEDEQRCYVRFLVDSIGEKTNGSGLGINAEHPHSGNVSINLALAEADRHGMEIQIGVYIPANTIEFEAACSKLKKLFKAHGCEMEIISKISPMYVSEENILIKTLQAGYFKATGKKPRLLSMCGSTYSKKMPNMVPFGATFSGEDDRAHAVDERLLISNLLESARIMAYAILEMAQ